MRQMLLAAILWISPTAIFAAEAETRLHVTGLTCPSCSYIVATALKRVDGRARAILVGVAIGNEGLEARRSLEELGRLAETSGLSVVDSVLQTRRKIDGRYLIDKKLGEGGFGAVYRGTQSGTNRIVALKLLHPEMTRDSNVVERFRREGQVLCSLKDAHTVTTYDFDQTEDGTLFIAMELLEGRSLHDVFATEAPITWQRMVKILSEMCSSLAEAHAMGIVHRDLKPENVHLEKRPGNDEFVKILDFGIAKVLGPEESPPSRTLAGAVFGTPEYMSPEAARGDEVDYRADIYSLGVILFDMLCGRPPFEATAAAEVLAMQIRDDPPSPRELTPHYEITEEAEALILRCMSKDPDQRYQSMDELREDLQNCYGSVGYRRDSVKFDEREEGSGPSQRRRRLTEELSEWMSTDDRRLSIEEARELAMNAFKKDD